MQNRKHTNKKNRNLITILKCFSISSLPVLQFPHVPNTSTTVFCTLHQFHGCSLYLFTHEFSHLKICFFHSFSRVDMDFGHNTHTMNWTNTVKEWGVWNDGGGISGSLHMFLVTAHLTNILYLSHLWYHLILASISGITSNLDSLLNGDKNMLHTHMSTTLHGITSYTPQQCHDPWGTTCDSISICWCRHGSQNHTNQKTEPLYCQSFNLLE